MKGKKLIAIILSLLLTLTLLPMAALAEGEETVPAETDDASSQTSKSEETPDENGNEEAPEEDETEILGGNQETEYYLIGTRIDWNQTYLSDNLKFSPNPNASGEYMLNINLTAGEEFKVIKIENGNVTWFPDSGSNYHVPEDHSGLTTVYFNETYQSGWSSFGGYFYVLPTYPIVIDTLYPSNAGTLTYPSRAAESKTVTITVTANEGFRIQSFALYRGNSWMQVSCTNDGPNYTFTMPSEKVRIDARFNEGKPINIVTQVLDGEGIHATNSTDAGTAVVSPASGFTGDTITLTVSPNQGYRFNDVTGDADQLTPVSGAPNTYTFKLTYTNDNAFTIFARFSEYMEEGYYLRIGDEADYKNWLLMDHRFPFFGGVTTVWEKKAPLTAGQQLQVYNLTYSGNTLQGMDTPVASGTVPADFAGGNGTVYYVREGTGELHVSDLTGYYIIRADVDTTRPYAATAAQEMVLTNGRYTFDGQFRGSSWVCVAEYSEGTVIGTYPNVNDVSTRFVTPRQSDNSGTYQGTGPECFPYDGAMGRAWFDPNGQGGEDYKCGYLKIRRLYTFEFDWNYDVINDADVYITSMPEEWAAENDTVTFEVEPVEGYVILGVTITQKNNGADVEYEEENGVHTFTMPASDVIIHAIFEEIPESYAYYVGKTGSFNDSIKLNFYVNYMDNGEIASMPEGIQAVLTYKVGNTIVADTIPITESMKTSNGYKVSHNLFAKQLEDVVNIKLVNSEGEPFIFLSTDGGVSLTNSGYDASLLDYLDEAMASSNTTAEMKALAQAAKDYCYAAAQQFNYNWDNQYTFSEAVDQVTADTLIDYAEVETGTYPAGVSHKGYTVMFETDNSFRKYLTFDADITDPVNAFTYTVGSATGPQLLQYFGEGEGYGYCLTFTNVYSNKLQKAKTIKISDGTDTYKLKASVLTYCRLVLLSDNTTASMKTLAKAAYLYNRAAIEKFGE